VKLGIVGSGNIVKQSFDATSHIDEISCEAIVVREKSLSIAKELQQQYKFAKIYTDYDEFLLDPDIEIIYIGITNNLHYDYTKRALIASPEYSL